MRHRGILTALVYRGCTVLRTEGVGGFFRRLTSFIRFAFNRVVSFRTVYLYQHDIVARDREQFLPRLDSWQLRIVHSDAEADAVAAEGFEDFRDAFVFAHRSLEAGAVAFCVYNGFELAHVGWVALDEAGKRCVDRLPFHVAWDSHQACTGGTYTMPQYRGARLMSYGYHERFEYLRTRGYTSSRNAVNVSNVASQKAHARFNPAIIGIGRYRRILWWHSWHEQPLPGGPCRGMPPSTPERGA